MTALLFKNWGFPHKVFKGVQTFESKKIKETLQIQRFSHFLILPQTGIEPVREYKSRRILSPVRLPVPPLRHLVIDGRWWIRTTEGVASRFTVCPLWPLGKSPISIFRPLELYHTSIKLQVVFRIFCHETCDFSAGRR